jgi:23S rRNA pseudouridine1911/1915/1917 synthase
MRRTDKRYLALVHDWPERDVENINLPIGKHPVIKEKNTVRFDETGKASVTIARVRERYLSTRGDKFALVELELKTGRTHQIRVHMSFIGYPIVGDDLYGGKHPRDRDLGGDTDEILLTRQALHATTLGIFHPMTEVPMSFTAPIASDLARLIAMLRASTRAAQLEPAVIAAGTTIDLAAAGL